MVISGVAGSGNVDEEMDKITHRWLAALHFATINLVSIDPPPLSDRGTFLHRQAFNFTAQLVNDDTLSWMPLYLYRFLAV